MTNEQIDALVDPPAGLGGRSMIAAFDLSFTGTGWAYQRQTVLGNPGPLFNTGLITSDPKNRPLDRMIAIAEKVINVLHSTERAKVVVLEGFAHGRAFQAHQMGGLGYIVREALQDNGFRWIEVAPSALKKFVSGSGNANKDVMLKNVYKRFAFDTNDHNIADAVGLLYVGLAIEGLWEPTTAEQRAVIDQIKGGHAKKTRKKREVMANE